MTCRPDSLWNAVRVSSTTRFPVRSRRGSVTVRITDSGSSAILSPWRSGESCLSKEQRETPLTRTTEVKKTRKVVKPEGRNPVGEPDPIIARDPVRASYQGFLRNGYKLF